MEVIKKTLMPQEVFNLVLKHFNGDNSKTWKWFTSPNPALNYQSPIKMIKEKKINKVINFALSQMELRI